MPDLDTDVFVVGSGPAGSTVRTGAGDLRRADGLYAPDATPIISLMAGGGAPAPWPPPCPGWSPTDPTLRPTARCSTGVDGRRGAGLQLARAAGGRRALPRAAWAGDPLATSVPQDSAS
jgi:hypothetical protein